MPVVVCFTRNLPVELLPQFCTTKPGSKPSIFTGSCAVIVLSGSIGVYSQGVERDMCYNPSFFLTSTFCTQCQATAFHPVKKLLPKGTIQEVMNLGKSIAIISLPFHLALDPMRVSLLHLRTSQLQKIASSLMLVGIMWYVIIVLA